MSNPYGNYSRYYSKRQVSLINGDPRVALLPPAWVKGKRVLDIGCNSGQVSVEIAQKLDPAQVVGVDIDPQLIKSANTHLAFVHSLQQPPSDSAAPETSSSAAEEEPKERAYNYFPISLPKTLGFIPLPTPSSTSSSSSTPPSTSTFPLNLSFHTANFVFTTPPSTPESYHLILAFSITKWIHLHHLDEGLTTFFQRIFDALEPGGRFIMEKQAWVGYRDGAKKGASQLKANLPLLQLRPEGFASVLREIGFEEEEPLRKGRFHAPGEKEGFDRPMEVFRKPLAPGMSEEVSSMEAEDSAVVEGGKKEKKGSKPSKKEKRKRDEHDATTDSPTPSVTN
ncbi:Bicoid-interacting protein 3-domain-containing protein [Mrakia frigida]|uniref:Bicoid-interacting protein 3-domain-containing protein n=1 Tax=Mrakia frigida TaxID=29902 RepID=UPI003FCC021F